MNVKLVADVACLAKVALNTSTLPLTKSVAYRKFALPLFAIARPL